MLSADRSFTYDQQGCSIVFGSGCIEDIGPYLADQGLHRALVICGSTVGANEAVMAPLRAGLGDRIAGMFDGTTPEKRATEVFAAIAQQRQVDADVLIGIGGGSSLDIARQVSAFGADDRSLADLEREAHESGEVENATETRSRTPVIVLPTTLAGADISNGGGMEVLSAADSPTGQPVNTRGPQMPIADFVDPELIATTPMRVQTAAAVNGFNKGLETPYARDATPIDDATAAHGVRLFSSALRTFGRQQQPDRAAFERAALGAVLVQLGRKVSIIHAFGHGFARRYPVQQGAVHAAVLPEVMGYVFSQMHANREVLALGLGIDSREKTDEQLADDIVETLTEIRDSLEVPQSLGSIPETSKADLPAIAAFIVGDPPMRNLPASFEPSEEAVLDVLHSAWD